MSTPVRANLEEREAASLRTIESAAALTIEYEPFAVSVTLNVSAAVRVTSPSTEVRYVAVPYVPEPYVLDAGAVAVVAVSLIETESPD